MPQISHRAELRDFTRVWTITVRHFSVAWGFLRAQGPLKFPVTALVLPAVVQRIICSLDLRSAVVDQEVFPPVSLWQLMTGWELCQQGGKSGPTPCLECPGRWWRAGAFHDPTHAHATAHVCVCVWYIIYKFVHTHAHNIWYTYIYLIIVAGKVTHNAKTNNYVVIMVAAIRLTAKSKT